MDIAVVGTGYVGLVAGTCFAESGNDVICVDIDDKKIAQLNRGEPTIYEPGLRELMTRNVGEGRLSFTTSLGKAVHKAHLICIAVGTPQDEDGSADLTHVLAVAHGIGKVMNGHKMIVTKSTVPVGTGERIEEALRQETDHPFDVVSNPEFLKEGNAVDDFMKPDRIIVGTDNEDVAEMMRNLYAPFVRTGNPVLVMSRRSAEMTKYVANCMLATKISFINDMANLCELLGANINAIREGISMDKRIGSAFIFPGCGYGGSCFPKDVKALIRTAHEYHYEPRILQSVEAVNADQKQVPLTKLRRHFGHRLGDCTIAVWGLSFKPNTNDMREAASLTLVNGLNDAGSSVRVYDPVAMDEARERHFGDRVTYCGNNYEALEGAHALVVITEWNEFRHPNFERMRELMADDPVLIDGRNIYQPDRMRKVGFTYYGIGIP